MDRAIAKPKLLLVEGKDEVNFFSALLVDLSLGDIQVQGVGGKSRLRDRLKVVVRGPSHEIITSVGIVRDADENPNGAFDSIRGALQAAGLPFPTAPLQPVVKDGLQVMVMILPDGKTPGMLEDLCLESVKETPAMLCVDEYFQCLKERLEQLPGNLTKARVRAFLASMEWLQDAHFEYLQKHVGEYLPDLPEAPSVAQAHAFLASRYKPNLDLGVAAQAGYWPFDHPAFVQAKQFLQML